MEVQVESTGPCSRKVSINIPADQVNAAFEAAYKTVAKGASVPGFRAGKAPRNLIEAQPQYRSQIYSQVENELVNKTLLKAMDDSKISPVNMPRVAVGRIEKDAAFNYTAEVEIQPEITLTQYKGLEAQKFPVVIEDKDIEAEIDKLRHRLAQITPVKDRTELQNGDLVVLDYISTAKGQPSEPLTSGAMLEVGAPSMAVLTNQLIGLKVPSSHDLSATFPADHSVRAWANNTVRFEVTLKEIKHRWLPPLDEALAEDLGEKSLEELRAKIRTQLQGQREQEAFNKERQTVLKSLVDKNPFEVPQSLVVTQAERMVQSMAQRFGQMMGKQLNMSQQEFMTLRDSSMADAEFQVRSALLLLEVAKAEKIEATPADVQLETEQLMALNPQVEKARLQAYFNEPQRQDEMRFRIVENKTVKYLLENAIYVAS